ncbi:hypothetical protein [Nostoc sp. CMAA1605]|uniref:hypothetical protein n=1 Tax=Nostoc sp. CMAA1605 TaxID=2055159 RepID=UPI001F1F9B09|nr:hypothetical protein [Nostoc sp. CMAA1605]MCF4970628.1 hypothetical protein [Nostoc sp. CMAA1605]
MAKITISDLNPSDYSLTELSAEEMAAIQGGGFLGKLIGGIIGGVAGFFISGPAGIFAGVGAGSTLGDAVEEVFFN